MFLRGKFDVQMDFRRFGNVNELGSFLYDFFSFIDYKFVWHNYET